MKLETILRPWPWLFAFLALACHFLIQWNFLSLPLIGDESYYANPEVMKSLMSWPDYSFGHPPLWHYLHALFYKALGLEAGTVRVLGLFFSTSLLIFIWSLGWFRKQMLAASVLMVMMACHEYVREFGSFGHPVIATALFGFASLFLADARKWWAFSLTLTLALLIRESALVFAVASLFFMDSPKKLKYLAPPLGLFLICYLWFFLERQGLLVNNQVQILLATGKTPFNWSLERLGAHVHFIIQLFPAGFILLVFLGLPAIFSSGKARWTPLTNALLAVFVLHTTFFGLYVDLGIRNTFLAAMALGLLVFQWTETKTDKPWINSIVLMASGVFTAFQLIQWTVTPSHQLLYNRDNANIHRSLANLVEPLVRNNQDVVVVATNPFHEYLSFPWLGYSQIPIPTEWYGGSPGYMKLPDFDVGIVHQPLEMWPEKDIFAYAKDNNFELYHEIGGANTTVQIWVRPGIKP